MKGKDRASERVAKRERERAGERESISSVKQHQGIHLTTPTETEMYYSIDSTFDAVIQRCIFMRIAWIRHVYEIWLLFANCVSVCVYVCFRVVLFHFI